MRNGVLTHLADSGHDKPEATLSMDKTALDRVGLGELPLSEAMQSGLLSVEGDATRVGELFAMLDQFPPSFNIVTPVLRP